MWSMLLTIGLVAACYIVPAYLPLFGQFEQALSDASRLDYSKLKALVLLSALLLSYHRYSQSRYRQRKIFFNHRSGRRHLQLPGED